jgi:Leucine-rich repeat (LRR) protein
MYLPPTLSKLVLSNNNIQGSLPEDIIRGASPALTTLEVTGNSLSGTRF